MTNTKDAFKQIKKCLQCLLLKLFPASQVILNILSIQEYYICTHKSTLPLRLISQINHYSSAIISLQYHWNVTHPSTSRTSKRCISLGNRAKTTYPCLIFSVHAKCLAYLQSGHRNNTFNRLGWDRGGTRNFCSGICLVYLEIFFFFCGFCRRIYQVLL